MTAVFVQDQDFRDSAKELEGVDIGADPGRQILGEASLSESVMAHPESSNKEIVLWGFSCQGILYRDVLTGIIDKKLLPGSIFLSEADIQIIHPVLITLAELAVLIPFWVGLFILAPEKLKRDAFPFEFLVKIIQGKHPNFLWSDRLSGRKKEVLQLSIIEISR